MATDFMSMAAKLSDLSNRCQVEKPAQGAVDWQEMEEEDSSPPNLRTWPPAQRLLLGHLNMKHCLEI